MTDHVNQDAWNTQLARLHEIRGYIAEHSESIAEARRRFEDDTESDRALVAQLRLEESEVLESIKEAAIANYHASKRKTFGGVQLKVTKRLRIHDRELALSMLRGRLFEDQPLVTETINEKAALGWVRTFKRLDVPIEGVEVEDVYSVAILAPTTELT